RVAWALFLIFFVWSIPVQGDEATVDPGAGIGPLKLGMYVDDAAKLFGRRFDGQQTGTCTAGSKWVFKQGDTLLVSGEEALLSTAVVLQQSGTLVSMITISGPHGQYKTDVGVGLGSPGADVAAEFGPPTGESSEGGGKWLSYEQQGVRFLVSDPGDVVQAVSIFWRAPKNTEIRPFDGIGPLRLGMDIKTAHMAEGMGRPHDVVTPLGRLAWAMPVTPRYTRVSCTPYVAVRVGSGKVRDIFTTASGFWTAQGVQVGDSVDALVKELGSGQSSPSTPGSLLWVNSNTAAKLIAGLRAASDGTKQIVFFWIRAF
ncbi:MAG TPA: hypothetical protein VHM88_03740, partial [Candidatus Acidoferrales bacterium]|nr:hypothetical protein [Candidatus Acidoferrales bacterium]